MRGSIQRVLCQRQPRPVPNRGDPRSARRGLASGWRTRWTGSKASGC